MKIEVTHAPEFRLPLAVEDVHLLCYLAEHHYDATCKAAAKVGGFMFGWSNIVGDIAMDSPIFSGPTCPATRHEIDITLKVLESRGSGLLDGRQADHERAGRLSLALTRALRRWTEARPANITIDTEAS